MTRYMHAFSLKLGLALHHEVTREVLQADGRLAARWFSNYDHATGVFPQTIFDHLLPPETLEQGRFEVSDQFQYAWRLTEGRTAGMYLGTFGAGFAVVAIVGRAVDAFKAHENMQVFSPLDVGHMLRHL